MHIFDVVIEKVFGCISLLTIFAVVIEGSGEVHAFNMFPQITAISSNFATKCTLMTSRT